MITQNIDLVQVMLTVFFLFFAGLVFYLRREDKREGYPLLTPEPGRSPLIGWPVPPPPKTYSLIQGGSVTVPHHFEQAPVESVPVPRNGMPMAVPGDLLTAGVGAGAYVMRSTEPMRTLDKELLLQPISALKHWTVMPGDLDPRGCRVLGRDFRQAGIVTDLWVDRAAKILRYMEVRLDGAADTLLLPIYHCDIDEGERTVRVLPLAVEQLPLVPRLAQANVMTPREEDRINAFYAGATLYADPMPPLMRFS